MGFLRDAAFAAAGYGLNSLIHSGERAAYENRSLEDIIMDYAHKHGVYGRDEEFYQEMMRIAEQFHDPYAYGGDC